jgi:phage-related protein
VPSYNLNITVTAKDKASGALKGIGSSLGGLGKAALAGGAVAGAAVAGIGLALGKLAIDAAPLEGIQNAFAGLAASSGTSMQDMLTALQKGSLGMVSQRDLMKTYNSAAQLVGTTFANQLPDAMGYLSKVSAATGEDMGFMLDSLVKGVGRLSPMILDNLGIQVALSEATARASEMFGVEASELTKTQTQAGMMNVVLEKLAENTASMPDITDTASTKMAQLGATFADIKDQVGLALLPILTAMGTALLEMAQTYGPMLVDFFQNQFVPFITEAMETIGEVVGTVLKAIQVFWAEHGAQIMETARTAWETIKAAIETAITVISEVVGAILAAISAFWDEHGDQIIETAKNAWEKIKAAISTIIEVISGIVNTVLAAIRSFWSEHGAQIMEIASMAWETIKTVVDAAIKALQTIIETVLAAIQNFWEAHGASLMDFARTVWNLIEGIIDTALEAIKGIIRAILFAVKGDWESAFSRTAGQSCGRSSATSCARSPRSSRASATRCIARV